MNEEDGRAPATRPRLWVLNFSLVFMKVASQPCNSSGPSSFKLLAIQIPWVAVPRSQGQGK